jgi:polyhydroxyalkanoate synthesis regulator phasin
MSNLTYNQLIEQTRQFQKQAAVKLAEITGESVEDMPGAEHDGKVPASFSEPDPQVADGTMGPDSARSIDGAGDDRPITAGSLFESDEPALNPEKKPMESSDWEAKSASAAMANDILSLVMNTKQASDRSNQVAQQAPAQAPVKQAATNRGDLELTSDILCKIAASMLSSDEGVQIVQDHLTKVAGAQEAEFILQTLAEKSAEVEAGERDAENMIFSVIKQAQAEELAAEELAAEDAAAAEDELGDVSVDEVVEAVVELVDDGEITEDEGVEILEAIGANSGVEDYEDAVEDIESEPAVEDTVEAGEKAAEALINQYAIKVAQEVAAEEAAMADAAAEEAAIDDAAAAEEAVSVEELAQGIEEMLNSGELSEEDAQSLITELAQEADPETIAEVESILAEEGMPADGIAEEAAMADAAAEDAVPMAPKTASAKRMSKFDALVYAYKNRF